MNDIDTLMARIDEINSKTPPLSADEVATLIEYHRHQRARKAAGEKPIKPKVDLSALLNLKPKPKSSTDSITRRL